MMITKVGDTTYIIIICSLSSMSLGGDKTTKLKYCVIRECHYLIHLTIWWTSVSITVEEERDSKTNGIK